MKRRFTVEMDCNPRVGYRKLVNDLEQMILGVVDDWSFSASFHTKSVRVLTRQENGDEHRKAVDEGIGLRAAKRKGGRKAKASAGSN